MSKFIKVGFYAVGTFLLLFSSIIVGANFVKDSGVFDKAVVEVKKQPVKVAEETTTPPKKIVIDSEPVQKEPAKKTAAATTTTPKHTKPVIEVINCTEKSGLAEETRGMLEAKGFEVSTGNHLDSTQGTSKIIIRKKGAKTGVISNMLKISVIKEELQPDSRFDITIIIGSDFNP